MEPTDKMIEAFGVGWHTENNQRDGFSKPGDRRRAGLKAALAELDLGEWLAGADDLEPIKAAMVREYSIRIAMLETGEDRQTIVDMIGAVDSMDQEAVLELTSGAPTTLADGLQAYIETLEQTPPDSKDEIMAPVAAVLGDLHALLTYPWPEEEATIATHGANASVGLRVEHHERPEAISVYVGGQEVYRGSTAQEAGVVGQEVAEAVHRAVLARVIGDRPHVVKLSKQDAKNLYDWLGSDGYAGSTMTDGRRYSVTKSVAGGVTIQTLPYVHVTSPAMRPDPFAQDA